MTYKTIFENLALGICRTDPEGVIGEVNPAFASLLGYQPEQLIGGRIGQFSHPEHRQEFLELSEALLGQEAGPLRLETRWLRKDGQDLWVKVTASPVRPTEVAWVAMDITSRRKAEAVLADLNQVLEERIGSTVAVLRQRDQMLTSQSRHAAMGEMIGNIAHQWRQPLNALSMLLINLGDAYRCGALTAQKMEHSLQKGDLLIQKMSSTINVFRDFFRPDKARTIFSALEQVRAAVAMVEASFEAAGIAIRIHAPQDMALSGFPNEYAQVLLNLLNNAKQAIQERRAVPGMVTLSLDQEAGYGRLRVRDNGVGIPANLLERIFEPYFSTRESGTGIGLYLAKQIIEGNMAGRISAMNTDRGTEFVVHVPLAGEPT